MGATKDNKSTCSNNSGTYDKSKILEHIAFGYVAKLSKQTADVLTCYAINQSTNKYLGWHLSLSPLNTQTNTKTY